MDCARNQSWHIDQLMIIVVGFVIPYDFFISDMCVCLLQDGCGTETSCGTSLALLLRFLCVFFTSLIFAAAWLSLLALLVLLVLSLWLPVGFTLSFWVGIPWIHSFEKTLNDHVRGFGDGLRIPYQEKTHLLAKTVACANCHEQIAEWQRLPKNKWRGVAQLMTIAVNVGWKVGCQTLATNIFTPVTARIMQLTLGNLEKNNTIY